MSHRIAEGPKGPTQLIEAANKNDRFRLLYDPSIPPPDLDNPIHPIFRESNFRNTGPVIYERMNQALQLASLFLHYDSVLEWFVSPLLGLPLTDSQSGKSYLSDPLSHKTGAKRKGIINRVRSALVCLSHCIHFEFVRPTEGKAFYARTLMDYTRPFHSSSCDLIFESHHSVRIEIRMQNRNFLQNNYPSSDLCEKLRHDFALASYLMHELCHAVGVMRRGHLTEPYIRLQDPEAEFGASWENFMFGGIINPFDRTSDAYSFLMQRPWANSNKALAAGSREYTDMPMSYFAKWFQKDTWKSIANDGPVAVSIPQARLKIRYGQTHYTILSNNRHALGDVREFQRKTMAECAQYLGSQAPHTMVVICTAKLLLVDNRSLHQPLIQGPPRFPVKSSRNTLSGATEPHTPPVPLEHSSVSSQMVTKKPTGVVVSAITQLPMTPLGETRRSSIKLNSPTIIPHRFSQYPSTVKALKRCRSSDSSTDNTTERVPLGRPTKRLRSLSSSR